MWKMKLLIFLLWGLRIPCIMVKISSLDIGFADTVSYSVMYLFSSLLVVSSIEQTFLLLSWFNLLFSLLYIMNFVCSFSFAIENVSYRFSLVFVLKFYNSSFYIELLDQFWINWWIKMGPRSGFVSLYINGQLLCYCLLLKLPFLHWVAGVALSKWVGLSVKPIAARSSVLLICVCPGPVLHGPYDIALQ